jgi:hypothetical protein
MHGQMLFTGSSCAVSLPPRLPILSQAPEATGMALGFGIPAAVPLAPQIIYSMRSAMMVTPSIALHSSWMGGRLVSCTQHEVLWWNSFNCASAVPKMSFLLLTESMKVKDRLLLTQILIPKLVLFSRPNLSELYNFVLKNQRLNIRNKNSKDIEKYNPSRLGEMVGGELFPSHLDTSGLAERLLLCANGVLLRIRLMDNFLNSPALTSRQRLDATLDITVPEGLESMHHRIRQLIELSNTVERDLTRRIFT